MGTSKRSKESQLMSVSKKTASQEQEKAYKAAREKSITDYSAVKEPTNPRKYDSSGVAQQLSKQSPDHLMEASRAEKMRMGRDTPLSATPQLEQSAKKSKQ